MSNKRGRPTWESMGLNPEVMAMFGYEDLDDFVGAESKVSPEQMKFLKICTQQYAVRAPKRSIQILDARDKSKPSYPSYVSPREALKQIEV